MTIIPLSRRVGTAGIIILYFNHYFPLSLNAVYTFISNFTKCSLYVLSHLCHGKAWTVHLLYATRHSTWTENNLRKTKKDVAMRFLWLQTIENREKDTSTRIILYWKYLLGLCSVLFLSFYMFSLVLRTSFFS